jgi:hypothetical protein
MDDNIFIKSDDMQIENNYEFVDSLESSDENDITDMMDMSSSNSLCSTDQEFKFHTYFELYSYIESKTFFDGTYYNYSMNKDKHVVSFRMRDFRKIVDTIMHYHVNYPIKN